MLQIFLILNNFYVLNIFFFFRTNALQLHMLPERRNFVKYQFIGRNIYVENNIAVNVHRCGYGSC